MKKVLGLSLIFLLSACATVNKTVQTNTKEQTKTESVNAKVVEIPTTTIGFVDKDETKFTTQTEPLKDVCADEYLLFLIKYPFEGLNALKHSYDAAVLYNQDLQKLITLTVESRIGQISMKDYLEEVNPLNEEMDFMNSAMEPLLSKFATIERTSRTLYPLCQAKLKTTMTSKKLDANSDGCELEQQSAYILDPYEVKAIINDGLITEAMISEKLNHLYKTVYDETQSKINLEEATSKFNQQMDDLNQSGLLQKSGQLLEKIVRSFQSTMDVKESCEKAPKN